MLSASKRTLNILAALTWYIGGVILLLKGRSLLLEANELEPVQLWPWLAAVVGIVVGLLEARRVFIKSCTTNNYLFKVSTEDFSKLFLYLRINYIINYRHT